ncbi:MAG: hypothetical protein AABZ15_14115 [Nitrospirota bacterium]
MRELMDNKESRAWSHMNIAQEYRYYCKLFGDMITRTPCLLRRKELNGKEDYACGGCSKDTMMNSRHNRLSALRERS